MNKPKTISLWGSEEIAEGRGHKMGQFRQGYSYCMHRGCVAYAAIEGSLPDLKIDGSAFHYKCPRGDETKNE